MNSLSDDDFRAAYSGLGRTHSTQREAMLRGLTEWTPRRPRLRFRPAVVAAAAAMLILGFGIAGFEALRPNPVYGLDGIRERLQSLNSLHVKGYIYHRVATPFGVAAIRFPTERYYQRPSHSFHTAYGFSSQGNDNLVKVTRSYSVSDGQRSLLVLHDEKKAVLTSAIDPLQTELSMESSLQINETGQLVSEHPESFERVGTERVNGCWCDIYQSKPVGDMNFWRRIWIDPKKELPVRVMGFGRGPDGEDELHYEDTEIRTNVDPPPELFSFEVPQGYELIEARDDAKVRQIQPSGSCGGGNYGAAEWIGLNIDDRAVLVCWSQWLKDKEKQVFFHEPPRFVLEDAPERPCTEKVLYETTSGNIRWRWSLVVPDDKKPLGKQSLAIKYRYPKTLISLSVEPLVFSGSRLSEIVEKVQRRSLEASGDFGPIKSLDQLRDLASKVRGGSKSN